MSDARDGEHFIRSATDALDAQTATTAFGFLPVPVVLVDPAKGAVVWANPAAADLLDRATDEAPTTSDAGRTSDAASGDWTATPTDPATPRRVHDLDLRTSQGVTIRCRVGGRTVTGVDGQALVIAVPVADAASSLAPSEDFAAEDRLYGLAFALAPVGVAVVSTAPGPLGRICWVNRALAEMVGRPPSQIIGAPEAELEWLTSSAAESHPGAGDGLGVGVAPPQSVQIRQADGSILGARLHRWPIAREDGRERRSLVWVDGPSAASDDTERALQSRLYRLDAELTLAVLAGESDDVVYQRVVDGAAATFEADNVTLGVADHDGIMHPVAAFGPISTALLRGWLPVQTALISELQLHEATSFEWPEPDLAAAQHESGAALSNISALSEPAGIVHGVSARFRPNGAGTVGLINVARWRTGGPFEFSDVEHLRDLAGALSTALALGKDRITRERSALEAERNRIARDLHDTVIQDLIGIGMEYAAGGFREPGGFGRTIRRLDGAIRRLRQLVFDLTEPSDDHDFAGQVAAVVDDSARSLGFLPDLSVAGPLADVGPKVAGNALAVLREALSNVAQHAGASHVEIKVRVDDDDLSIVVDDDGVGIADGSRRGHGIGNLVQRAAELKGRAAVAARTPTGTRVSWSVPAGRARQHHRPTTPPLDPQPPDPHG